MPIKYIPYSPEPVAGQALLNNFNRVLKYQGSNDLTPRLERGMPYYEAELKETAGKADSGNMVIRGDCLSTCAYLKDKGIKVDLVYIDPPFASGADYAKKILLRRNPVLSEKSKIATDSLDLDEIKQFDEKMYGDIWDKEKYLSWMYENLLAIKTVMSENASIYVHLDWHIDHYVKVMMDEIFGEDRFQNEIIWKRTTAKSGSSFYNHIHDVILFYAPSDDSIWNQQYTPYTQEYIDSMFRNADSDGRKWRASPITGSGITSGSSGKPWRGIDPGKIGLGRHWAIPGYLQSLISEEAKNDTIKALDELDSAGRIVWAKDGTGQPSIKQYIDDLNGIELQSIWTDIGTANATYSTEKPQLLLERIILSSSNKGMIVADFFGGSGVTAAVADRLGRNFIHADVGINSIQTTHDRLFSQKSSFDLLEIKRWCISLSEPYSNYGKNQEFYCRIKA